ncbi:MAG: sodium:solute symporter [Marinilabiliales bacterium]|nr:MAG: sodium:solute symporter [Marinilabiliales bacterium]
MAIKVVVLALYALMIIVVGIIGMRKTKSFSDFFLGGGNVGPWMTAFSYGTAYFSAVVFIGFAGKIGWGFGFSGIWIGVFNALIGVLGVWAIMGWKIKKMSTDYGVSTLSEFLEKRYNSSFFKIASSVAIFIFLVPYSAAVFIGLSKLFEASFPEIQYWHIVVAMGVFTSVYLSLGGYKSMTMIDTIFGMIMTASVIVLVLFTVNKGGGMISISETLANINPKLTAVVGPPGWWPLFSLIFLTSVAPFAMPQLVQKFYAVKDRRSIRIGMVASTFFALLIGCIAYFIGSTTRVFLNPENAPLSFPNGAGGGLDPDALMPELLNYVVPESLTIIILILILSASMSTLAALVLISSSSLVKDFYAGFINKNVSDKGLTSLMRVGSILFVLISVIIALIKPDSIVAILGISWGAIGSFFLGPFIWGLFTKWSNKFGGLSSAFIGLAVCIILYIAGMPSPQAGTVGMITSLLINPIFSYAYNIVMKK